jgi:stearoyl-CoA desaturase (delta-9 desaturase)
MYILLCIVVFLAAYTLNLAVITVGYHRGLAHGAVRLHPKLRWLLLTFGNWITGLDPKAWAVMHRMHHEHSDTPLDPHSPTNVGITGILLEQLRSYERVIIAIMKNDEEVQPFLHGLDFELNWLNRRGLWWLPYVVHASIAGLLAYTTGAWLLALALFVGMLSHPIQGGLVNAFGHAVGGRNFDTDDDSRNNLAVAWLVAGEGFQNNHHAFPSSAKFSYQPWEVDLGFAACLALETVGLVDIETRGLIGTPATAVFHGPELGELTLVEPQSFSA